jgi:hypothetical protein
VVKRKNNKRCVEIVSKHVPSFQNRDPPLAHQQHLLKKKERRPFKIHQAKWVLDPSKEEVEEAS